MKQKKTITFFVLLQCFIFSSNTLADPFSLVSFNIWGVPFAAYDTWRFQDAMDEITRMSPDFVVLEEVFTKKGKRAFQDRTVFPYQVTGPRAFPRLVSSGLRILSKHPIKRAATLVYRSCKKDDCLSRKGAVLAVITLPSGKMLNLVATHLNARGNDATRVDQLNQLKIFMDYYAEPSAPTVIAGDFNFNPDSPAYSYLLNQFNATDTWAATQPPTHPGYTYDCVRNQYARDYSERYRFPLVQERIDYLLTTPEIKPLNSEMIFTNGTLLSDHFGLRATYDF